MDLLTIKVPTKVKARIAEFVKELGGEVISVERETSDVQKAILLKE